MAEPTTYAVEIRAGDSTDVFYVKAEDIDADDSSLYQRVVRGATQLLAPVAITDKATGVFTGGSFVLDAGGTKYFRVYLTPTQTASLAAGAQADWVLQLDAHGESPPFSREWTHAKLQISTGKLTPP